MFGWLTSAGLMFVSIIEGRYTDMVRLPACVAVLIGFAVCLIGCGGGGKDAVAGLRVVATTPDCGDLVSVILGDRGTVTVLTDGPSDPHMVAPTQSMVTTLSKADLLVAMGQGLEDYWLFGVVNRSKNTDTKVGGSAYLSLDTDMDLLETGHNGHDEGFDEGALSVSLHTHGDSHFLLDPLNGIKAADTIRAKLTELDPEGAAVYTANLGVFAKAIEELMYGADGESGLMAAFAPYKDIHFVGDHDLWTYFSERFGIRSAGYMEELSGIPPSVPHMTQLVKTMKEKDVRIILVAPFFDRRHAEFLVEKTGAKIVTMAHQVQAVPEAETYLDSCRYNAKAVLSVLGQ